MNFFLWYDSQNWPFFVWFSELNFFKYDSGKWTFFSNTTHRIDFFDKNDSKNWTFFSCDAKNWTFFLFASKNWGFFLNMTQRIELFFLQFDSKNWTFFLNWTQRVEPIYWVWLKELNLFVSSIWLKELNFFSIWLKELNVFLSMIQRIESLFEDDSKKSNFFFFEYDSMNRTFFNLTRRIDFFFWKKREWLKELKFLEHESKNWIFEFFWKKKNDSKNWAFLKNTIQRTELFFQYDWIFFFSKYDSKNLTLHFTMTQRLCFFFYLEKIKEFDFFYDSQTWTFFFLNIFSKKKKDSKNWAFFFFELWLSKYIFLKYECDSQNIFFQYDSQNWFFFFEYDLFFLTLNFFFWMRLKELKSPIRLRGITFFSLICLKE